MNARIVARVLGASAALALLIPAAAPASAQAWNGGYGPGPEARTPPPPGYPAPGYPLGYQGYPGDQDYAAPPESVVPRDYQSENQDYPPPNYGPSGSAVPYGPSQEYGANRAYGPNAPYPSDQTYGANQAYGPGEGYAPDERYGPDEAYGPHERSLYRAPEVPPLGQGYAGSSEAPERYGSGTSQGWSAPPAEGGAPQSGWGAPRAGAGHYAPAPREQLVSVVDVNLRAGPSNAAPVRTVLPAGTPVHVTGSTDGGWVQVDSPLGPGWVYGRYLARS